MRNLLSMLALLGLGCFVRADEPLGAKARAVLQMHCAPCHGGGVSKGGFGFALDRDRLIGRALVTPGQAGHSDLFLRVKQGEMPPKSAKTRPSAREIKILEEWIDAGAPAFEPADAKVRLLSPLEVVDAVLADLDKMEPRRRRFMRYLTLGHLAGAGRSADDLAATRSAAGKLLNSLSWHARITVPETVDAGAMILRLDLRSYKWNAELWEKLAAAYPYRLQTVAQSKALREFTDSELPVLRADWFIANAARPPLYHDLLQLPESASALERLLQIDVAADLQADSVMRSGFNDSGVSKNNRLLERHDSPHGAYWRSYDFAANTGRQSLFEHPIGPNTGEVSFQPAGGEMIFHLPNGLQGYMLVDGKGKRIDKGPIEIVADPRRPDSRVETGISCMSCHARGLIFKADQLRGHVEKNAPAFGKAILDTIRATHPRPARFKAQIEEDNTRYARAMEKFGLRDADQEPINLVTQRFEATLDGASAAAELGLKMDELAAIFKKNPEEARVLGGLLVKGGTVQRSVFQEHFPELARHALGERAVAVVKSESAFAGHTAALHALAFSRDGQWAASGGDDRAIRLWEIPSGKPGAVLEIKGGGEIYALAFSSDRKFLLSAGRDRLVRLWDLGKRLPIRVFDGHTGSVRCAAFSPNGKWAISGGDDRSLRIWNVADGTEKSTLVGHTGAIIAAIWSRDGKRVLSASRDGTARWWDWQAGKELACLEGHAGEILCAALADDGQTALTGGNDKTIRLWNLAAAKEIHAFTGNASAVIAVQFHPNQREFFSSTGQHRGAETTWRRWDLASKKEIAAHAAGPEDRFGCAAFSPDGRHILVGGPAGFLRLWSW